MRLEKKNERQKIDWRASLATDDQRELFDKLKDFGESIKELKRIFDEVEYFCFPKQNAEWKTVWKKYEKIFRIFGCSSVVWTIFIFQFFPYDTEIYQLIYFSEQMILWNQFVI